MKRTSRLPARNDGVTVTFDVSTEAHPDVWATVDAGDWPALQGVRWSATKRANGLYVRNAKHGLLHRFLLAPEATLVVDHRDGNPLNNTRGNLRVCTLGDNGRFAGDRWRGHSIVVEKTTAPTKPHVVKARLADGSVKEYTYPTRSKRGTKAEVFRKMGPIR